jgi:hypothetical protein
MEKYEVVDSTPTASISAGHSGGDELPIQVPAFLVYLFCSSLAAILVLYACRTDAHHAALASIGAAAGTYGCRLFHHRLYVSGHRHNSKARDQDFRELSSAGVAVGMTLALLLASFISSSSPAANDCPVCQNRDTAQGDDGYQYAVHAVGPCSKAARRTVLEGALNRWLDDNFSDDACGLQCIQLDNGDGLGFVLYGQSGYDWEHYLNIYTSVGRLGHCDYERLGA